MRRHLLLVPPRSGSALALAPSIGPLLLLLMILPIVPTTTRCIAGHGRDWNDTCPPSPAQSAPPPNPRITCRRIREPGIQETVVELGWPRRRARVANKGAQDRDGGCDNGDGGLGGG